MLQLILGKKGKKLEKNQWFFHPKRMACVQFAYGGNADDMTGNVFATKDMCYETCTMTCVDDTGKNTGLLTSD